ETRQHHLAGLLGRVDHAVSVGRVRLDQFDLATNPRQALCNERGELIEPFAIPASGFDRHQFLKRIEEGCLLLRGQRWNRFDGCSVDVERGDETQDYNWRKAGSMS